MYFEAWYWLLAYIWKSVRGLFPLCIIQGSMWLWEYWTSSLRSWSSIGQWANFCFAQVCECRLTERNRNESFPALQHWFEVTCTIPVTHTLLKVVCWNELLGQHQHSNTRPRANSKHSKLSMNIQCLQNPPVNSQFYDPWIFITYLRISNTLKKNLFLEVVWINKKHCVILLNCCF